MYCMFHMDLRTNSNYFFAQDLRTGLLRGRNGKSGEVEVASTRTEPRRYVEVTGLRDDPDAWYHHLILQIWIRLHSIFEGLSFNSKWDTFFYDFRLQPSNKS